VQTPQPPPPPPPPPMQAYSSGVGPETRTHDAGGAVGLGAAAEAGALEYPLPTQPGGGGDGSHANHEEQHHRIANFPPEPSTALAPAGLAWSSPGLSGNTSATSTPGWTNAAEGVAGGAGAAAVTGDVQHARAEAVDGGAPLAGWDSLAPPLPGSVHGAAGAAVAAPAASAAAAAAVVPTPSAVKWWEGVPHALEELQKAVEAFRQQAEPSTASDEERELAAVLEASRVVEVTRQ
ncbi:unnamed protein product, partial [Laminaria digitata]